MSEYKCEYKPVGWSECRDKLVERVYKDSDASDLVILFKDKTFLALSADCDCSEVALNAQPWMPSASTAFNWGLIDQAEYDRSRSEAKTAWDVRQETEEREQLRTLLAKYPDMKGSPDA